MGEKSLFRIRFRNRGVQTWESLFQFVAARLDKSSLTACSGFHITNLENTVWQSDFTKTCQKKQRKVNWHAKIYTSLDVGKDLEFLVVSGFMELTRH